MYEYPVCDINSLKLTFINYNYYFMKNKNK